MIARADEPPIRSLRPPPAPRSNPTHLVRSFAAEFGIPPHRYLTGRRLDRARRQPLAGERAGDVAVAVGFHDQAT